MVSATESCSATHGPQIGGDQQQQRPVMQPRAQAAHRMGKAVSFQQGVLFQPAEQNSRQRQAQGRSQQFLHADCLGQGIRKAQGDHINADPHQGKAQGIALVKLRHRQALLC